MNSFRPPVLAGLIERRVLVNYRADPDVVARILPARFRPQLVNGNALVGVCLIRLAALRPRHLPAAIGLASENAAHRIAVSWTDDATGVQRNGVYIPRRDTGSRLNTLVGGRVFPGAHTLARVDTNDSGRELGLEFDALDGGMHVQVVVEEQASFTGGALFESLTDASRFFESGCDGYSPGRRGWFEGLQLRTDAWRVRPARVRSVRSSFFDDERRFPIGSIELDHALVMRDIPVTWHPLTPLTADPTRARIAA
jgi:hypothetical protein